MNPLLGIVAFLIERIPAQLCFAVPLVIANVAWCVWTYRGLMR